MRLYFFERKNNMKLVTLDIEGMHCSMCEAHVLDQIRKVLPTGTKLKANHKKGTVVFVVDDDIDASVVKDAISKEGYKVLSYKEEEYHKTCLFSFLKK